MSYNFREKSQKARTLVSDADRKFTKTAYVLASDNYCSVTKISYTWQMTEVTKMSEAIVSDVPYGC